MPRNGGELACSPNVLPGGIWCLGYQLRSEGVEKDASRRRVSDAGEQPITGCWPSLIVCLSTRMDCQPIIVQLPGAAQRDLLKNGDSQHCVCVCVCVCVRARV